MNSGSRLRAVGTRRGIAAGRRLLERALIVDPAEVLAPALSGGRRGERRRYVAAGNLDIRTSRASPLPTTLDGHVFGQRAGVVDIHEPEEVDGTGSVLERRGGDVKPLFALRADVGFNRTWKGA